MPRIISLSLSCQLVDQGFKKLPKSDRVWKSLGPYTRVLLFVSETEDILEAIDY